MHVEWRTRILGGILALAAIPVFLVVTEPLGGALAFSLAATGLFIAVVVAERAVPAATAEALVAGAARPLAELSRGLKVQGPPVYVHDQGNVGSERLFLPASRDDRPVPVLDPETTAYSGSGGTKVGLAFAPPGLALVDAHARDTDADLRRASLPEVEAFLDRLGRASDLARAVKVTKEGDAFHVRFAVGAARPPCFDDPADPLCGRTGCALCQAAGCSLARALGQPLTVAQATVDPPTVSLVLRPEGAPKA